MTDERGQVRHLHRDAVVVDGHHDLLLLVARDRLFGITNSFATRWVPELRSGGIDVQVLPIHMEREFPPEATLRRTMQLIAYLYQEVAANPADVALCRTGEEIDRAVGERRIALLLALEGSQAIGDDIELFELFFALGLRMASLSWSNRTLLADGSAEDAAGGRLPRAGVAAVRELERLGIVVDISHLSSSGTDHVLEAASRPLVASHSSARALADHPRNLPDEQLRGVAALGGVVGVNFFPLFIDPLHPTIDRVIDHIEHVAEVAGIDHVGIATDFVRDLYEEKFPPHRLIEVDGFDARIPIEGLAATTDLPQLTAGLIRRGFSEEEARKVLGENFLRVFREVVGRPGP